MWVSSSQCPFDRARLKDSCGVSNFACLVARIMKLGVKVSGRCSLGGVGGALDWILANCLSLIFSFRKWEFSRSHSHKSSHEL